jgi:hypothetical protein
VTLGLAVPFWLFYRPAVAGALTAIALAAVGVAVVGMIGFASVWAMRAGPRHQRLGDLLAGSFVLARAPGGITPAGSPTALPPPLPSSAPGAGFPGPPG